MSLQDSYEPTISDTGPHDEKTSESAPLLQDERYRLSHASQIGSLLRDLGWQRCMVTVRTQTGHQFVTSILHVDPVNHTFVFDWCKMDAERQSLLTSAQSSFSGLLRGVPVNFVISQPAVIDFDNGHAFLASFPEKLYYFQRRRHFRARTLVTRDYCCEVRLPDNSPLLLDIADLSLSGVGLRSKSVSDVHLPVGTVSGRCRLDFRELGKLNVDLQVMGHWLVGHGDTAIHHYGCVFVNLDGTMDNLIQRLVFALELAHRT